MINKLMSESMFKEEINLFSEQEFKNFLLDNGAVESYIKDHYLLDGDDPNHVYRTAEDTYKAIKCYDVVKDVLYVKLKLLEEFNNVYSA